MKKFLNLLLKILGFKERVIIKSFNPSKMRMEDWRKSESLVVEAHKLFENPTFKLMIEVLRNESPVNYQSTVEGMSANRDVWVLGDIRGYQKALNNLESFATPYAEEITVEPTFERETPETESKK